ncbi:MAG TPA: DUF5615 family PIN-like protein [Flavisolibacter sp.]|nr:DUF5615 family PIN-like protein [Flavisolibacter sp.]
MNKPLPFVAAQGVEKAIVVALRKLCDVVYIAETMASAKDDAVLHEANLPDRILITLDKDFGEAVYVIESSRRNYSVPGAKFSYRRSRSIGVRDRN